SRGQRPSASETAIPGRIPNASAAPLTSPTACSRPGSGARASRCDSISRRPPTAASSEKRGMRTEPMVTVPLYTNVCSQGSKQQATSSVGHRAPTGTSAKKAARCLLALAPHPPDPADDLRADLRGGGLAAEVVGADA